MPKCKVALVKVWEVIKVISPIIRFIGMVAFVLSIFLFAGFAANYTSGWARGSHDMWKMIISGAICFSLFIAFLAGIVNDFTNSHH